MRKKYLQHIHNHFPEAVAILKGSPKYPDIRAKVEFFQTEDGVLVAAEAHGLPMTETGVFAFHIHAGKECAGTETDPFAKALGHFNPQNKPHPEHEGDLPPLFSNNGNAFSMVLTDRFKAADVVDRTIIIHYKPDDFTTQPSGNAGEMIACGVIVPVKRLPDVIRFNL